MKKAKIDKIYHGTHQFQLWMIKETLVSVLVSFRNLRSKNCGSFVIWFSL